MRNVAFHLDPTVILDIQQLRGRARRRKPDEAPLLDDKQSFELAIDSALIGITPASLSDLLNRYTFAYPGADLRRLGVTIENGLLKQQGKLHGVSFTVLAELSLTPEGELRLHPKSVKAVGIKVGGPDEVLRAQPAEAGGHAAGERRAGREGRLRADADGATAAAARGRAGGAAGVTDNEIVLGFVPTDGKRRRPLKLPRPQAKNYMFFREGVLRFGKLTMRRHRSLHRRRRAGRSVRLLPGSLQRAARGRVFAEHARPRAGGDDAGLGEAQGLDGRCGAAGNESAGAAALAIFAPLAWQPGARAEQSTSTS